MGTVPANFPPDPFMQVGQIQMGNKQGITGAFSSTVFFTAPISGMYAISTSVRINSTDAAGSITVTVTPPHSVAIPGVQAAPATPSDGKFPSSMVWMNAGETITAAATVSGLTGTNYDVWIAAQRMS
jgi:hypothetical protein